MPDDMRDIPMAADSELPRRDAPARTAQQELRAAGYEIVKKAACLHCGKVCVYMESPASTTTVVNFDGSLHVNCRELRDPVPEPLPPPMTMEQQQEKLDQLMREAGIGPPSR